MTNNTADHENTVGDGPAASWRVWLLLACVALPVFCIGQAVTHMRTDEADSWLFAYYGDRMLAGSTLYADYWDNKPPGIFWINALGLRLSGGAYGGVIALCVAASLGVMVLFTMSVWRWFGPAIGGVGAVLAALYLWLPAYRGGSNRPEVFVMLFDLAVVYAYVQALQRHCAWRWIAIGALATGAVVFKQTGVAALAAIVVHSAWRILTDPDGRRRVCGQLLLIGAGLGGTVLLTVAVLALTSDLRWAYDAVIGHVLRFADSHDGVSWPRWFGLRDHVHNLALPLILAGAGVAVWLTQRLQSPATDQAPTPLPVPDGVPGVLLAWLLISSYVVFIGPSDAFHYVPTALTPLLLLATWALTRVVPWPQLPRAQRLLYRWLALLWMAYMAITPVENHAAWLKIAYHARYEDPNPFGTRYAREFVEAHTTPEDGIYIWDYAPRVYWETRRPCPSRYTSALTFSQVGPAGQGIVDDTVARLAAAPPAIVLLTHRAARQMAAGEWDGDVKLTAFGRWLCDHYRPATADDPGSMLVHRGRPR